jgi:hypothetical protein
VSIVALITVGSYGTYEGAQVNRRINGMAVTNAASATKAAAATKASHLFKLHSTAACPFCRELSNLQSCHDLMDAVSTTHNTWHNTSLYKLPSDNNVANTLYSVRINQLRSNFLKNRN